MKLDGKHIAILAENDYEDLELWYPYYRMSEEGAAVTLVGPQAQTYASKHGYPAKVDAAAETVNASQFDAVIVPGGFAPDRLRRYPAVLKLVREANEQGKVVAAICHAGWVLISAKILDGKRATSVGAIKDDMVNAGAQWVDEPVVRDGTIITSRTPADLPVFCREIIQTLGEK